MQTLPLSWSLETNPSENNISSKIINENLTWLSICSFQNHSQFTNFINQHSNKKKQNLIIRGCNNSLVSQLKRKGYSSTRVGMEAVLETSGYHFEKKSIRQLVKRGMRHGKVIQLPYSIFNKQLLEKFHSKTTHANEPQLQNLFQTKFTKDNLLYVFSSPSNKWLGAVIISVNGNKKLHTELILRTNNSPIGILETIIYNIFLDAKKDGRLELSLGEVPFISKNETYEKSLISYTAMKFGRILKFAYSYDGLYNFKNKFEPRWDNLYVCSKPKIGIEHLVFLFIKSNFHKLVYYKIKSKLKTKKSISQKKNSANFNSPLLDFN
ncbi:MAG: DUF2156 domain-containing protein [Ignavibacteriae bacterium]|nr:DUF2156 domain-containing protein [Ignavibacteriota bacterium]